MKVKTALFLFFLLALPFSGFSQSTLNFPRLFSVADLGNSGFAAVNPSASAATLTFTLYSASGVVVATSAQSISAGGQNSKLGSELFPGANTAGWIRGTSSTTGLQGFWLGGDFNHVDFLDGAEAAPAGQEFIFPLATGTTELNVASLAASTNTLTIRVYDAAGTILGTATQSVSTNGIYKSLLPALFPSVNFTNARYVKVTGTGNITGTTVAVDFIYAPSWSVVNGIPTSSTATEANFPHVPSGPENGSAKWNGVIGITNLASTAQTITLTYNRSTGSPVTATRSLSANGSLRESVKDVFTFGAAAEDGWIRVTGTAPIGGYIAYGYSGTNGVAVVPLQTVPRTQLMFSHVANGPFWGTGLALLNATATDANVEVYIMRRSGALVGGALNVPTASFVLPAGKKTAKLLDELVPASKFDDGFVYLKSTNNVALYAFQLFFSRDLKVVANVAAGVINSSISYTPPPPPPPPPAITSMSPNDFVWGESATSVQLTGTGMTSVSSVEFSDQSGLRISNISSTSTNVNFTLAVDGDAVPGDRTLVVTNSTNGRSNTVPFSVRRGNPTITNFQPSVVYPDRIYVTTSGLFGWANRRAQMFIQGTDLGGVQNVAITPNAGLDLQFFKPPSQTEIDGQLTVSSGTPTGLHRVNVSSPGGTSADGTFDVQPAPATAPIISNVTLGTPSTPSNSSRYITYTGTLTFADADGDINVSDNAGAFIRLTALRPSFNPLTTVDAPRSSLTLSGQTSGTISFSYRTNFGFFYSQYSNIQVAVTLIDAADHPSNTVIVNVPLWYTPIF